MNEEEMDKGPQWGGFLGSNGDSHWHRRRFSESDACLLCEDGGFGMGYGPCAYFARGFCKNVDNCKFIHGGFGVDDVFEGGGGGGLLVGSPRQMEGLYLQQHEEIMRMKAAQQQQRQRLAYDKYMNFLLQQRDDPHCKELWERAASTYCGFKDIYNILWLPHAATSACTC